MADGNDDKLKALQDATGLHWSYDSKSDRYTAIDLTLQQRDALNNPMAQKFLIERHFHVDRKSDENPDLSGTPTGISIKGADLAQVDLTAVSHTILPHFFDTADSHTVGDKTTKADTKAIDELKKAAREGTIAKYVIGQWRDQHPHPSGEEVGVLNKFSKDHDNILMAKFEANGERPLTNNDLVSKITIEICNETDRDIKSGAAKKDIDRLNGELGKALKPASQGKAGELIEDARYALKVLESGQMIHTEQGSDKLIRPEDHYSGYIDIKDPKEIINAKLTEAGVGYEALDPDFDLRDPKKPHKTTKEMEAVVKFAERKGNIAAARGMLADIETGNVDAASGIKSINERLSKEGVGYDALDPKFDFNNPSEKHKSAEEMKAEIKIDVRKGHIALARQALAEIKLWNLDPYDGKTIIEAHLKMAGVNESALDPDFDLKNPDKPHKTAAEIKTEIDVAVKGGQDRIKGLIEHNGSPLTYPGKAQPPALDPDLDKLLNITHKSQSPDKKADSHPLHAVMMKAAATLTAMAVPHPTQPVAGEIGGFSPVGAPGSGKERGGLA